MKLNRKCCLNSSRSKRVKQFRKEFESGLSSWYIAYDVPIQEKINYSFDRKYKDQNFSKKNILNLPN